VWATGAAAWDWGAGAFGMTRATCGAGCGCGAGAVGITCATCGAARSTWAGGAANERMGATCCGAAWGWGGGVAAWGAGCGCGAGAVGVACATCGTARSTWVCGAENERLGATCCGAA